MGGIIVDMDIKDGKRGVVELVVFRSLMDLGVSKDDVKRVWGKMYLKSLELSFQKSFRECENHHVLEKIEICKSNISKLMIFNWVRFVGISGSVGAGFAKEDDDIDLFIVVRDGSMWIYRGLLMISNVFHNRIRSKRHKNVKDRFCINLICEERGIQFEDDIFNFHELVYVKPVFNEKYLNYIYSKNEWLVDDWNVKKDLLKTRVLPMKRCNLFVRIFNELFFFLQLIFMIVSNHSPNIERLKNGNKKGRIEFFPKDYRENKIKDYLKEFKSTN